MHHNLTKQQTKSVISNLHSVDLSHVKRISDHCFGNNYLTVNTLNKILKHEGVFLKIELHSRVVGFCLAVMVESLTDEKWFSTTEFKAMSDFPYGIIKTIAIDPKYQGNGLGSQLLESAVLKLEAKYQMENMFYPAWMISNQIRLKSKLLHLGFKFSKELKQYWFTESINQNYTCAHCGKPPCTCSLGLFNKTM